MTRHRLDWFSLLSGLVLSTIAVIGLTGVDLEVLRWLGPAALIGIGGVVLASVISSMAGSEDEDTTQVGPTSE